MECLSAIPAAAPWTARRGREQEIHRDAVVAPLSSGRLGVCHPIHRDSSCSVRQTLTSEVLPSRLHKLGRGAR
jgi:hypothetical protein